MRLLVICCLLLFIKEVNGQKAADSLQITGVVFVGNNKTKEQYLRRFIDTKEGGIYDSVMVSEDLRRLRTLPSVLETTHFTVQADSGIMLIYQITEKFTIFPLGDFGVSNDYFYFGLGAMEYNGLGKGVYFLGFYRYSRQHSFQTIFKIPYLYGSKFGLHAQAYLWNTEEPIFQNELSTKYKYQYADIQLLIRYEFAHEHHLHFGINYHYDDFQIKDTLRTGIMDEYFRVTHAGLKLKHKLEHIDHNSFLISGWSNELQFDLKFPDRHYKPYTLMLNKSACYKNFGKWINLAARFQFGFSTDNFDPFSVFTLDDYSNLRGVGYNAYRGNALAVLNAEYRQTIYAGKILASQMVLFNDIGTIKQYGQIFNDMLSPKNYVNYFGAGLRLFFVEVHNAVVTLDYGINAADFSKRGFVFRWGQFF